jgi:hypothetical protein
MMVFRLNVVAFLIMQWIVMNVPVGQMDTVTQADIRLGLVRLNELRALANYEPKPWLLRKMVEWWVLPDIDAKIGFFSALLLRGEFVVGAFDGGGFVMDYTKMQPKHGHPQGRDVSGGEMEVSDGDEP